MITIYWKAIKRDVDRQTYKIGNVKIADKMPDKTYEVQTDDGPTDLRIVLRWAEEGIAMVRGFVRTRLEDKLAEESARGAEAWDDEPDEGADDKLVVEDEYAWEFGFKAQMAYKMDERSTAILIHQFVVAYIMWQWTKSFFGEYTPQYERAMATAKDALEDSAYSLATPRKRRRMKENPQITVEYTD